MGLSKQEGPEGQVRCREEKSGRCGGPGHKEEAG